MVVGDLTELFAERVDARRSFNRLWFWSQAWIFAAAVSGN